MWTIQDNTKKTGGYLCILRDGVRVADAFPFAAKCDGTWVREQAYRIVEAMNDLDMIKVK